MSKTNKKIEVVKSYNDFRVVETIEKMGEDKGSISIHILFNGTRKECFDYISERNLNYAQFKKKRAIL